LVEGLDVAASLVIVENNGTLIPLALAISENA
jgi:hypothetical protein